MKSFWAKRVEDNFNRTIKGNKKNLYVKLSALFFVACFLQANIRAFAESPEYLECSMEIDESDTAFVSYVQEYVPEGFTLAEGEYRVYGSYYRQNGDVELIGDEFETSVYTFASAKSEDVYTVVSITYPYHAWKSRENELRLDIADSLWPYSPVEGVLFTRNAPEEAWKETRRIVPVQMGVQTILFSGKQLVAKEPYSRIIFGFPSTKNMDVSGNTPLYWIQCTMYETLYISVWLFVCIALVLVLAAGGIGLFLKRKKRFGGILCKRKGKSH